MATALAWLIYDIVDDKKRSKVAKACKKAGLSRVQKSVFLGRINQNRLDELSERCLGLINESTDSVYVFPFCQEDFRKIKVHGQGFDKSLVNEEILQLFF